MLFLFCLTYSFICTPQTWDNQFSACGYTLDSPLFDYFKAINDMLDVFIASTMDVADFFGNPEHEINAFIDQYCGSIVVVSAIYLIDKKHEKSYNLSIKSK